MAIVVLVGLPAVSLRADETSPALAQFDDPVDKSLDKALAFLAKQQQPNGSFSPAQIPDSTAIASLSIMAFLAKGHTPGAGPYGDIINKGVDYVLTTQKPNGMLTGTNPTNGPMYAHAISTLMLSEVSGMVDEARQKKIDKVLPLALKAILSAQQVKKAPQMQGGWRYDIGSGDSDISCTGWALMSLRSARNSGATVAKESIDQAVQFILNCRMPVDGGFAYQPGSGSGLARTGTGLLCLELCGKHDDKATAAAGEWILKHLPSNVAGEFFYYSLYYSSQGMFQLGGPSWEKWATHMYQFMLKVQQADGSWPQGGANEAQVGLCYSTAMGVLAMSVSCRQLPIYQR